MGPPRDVSAGSRQQEGDHRLQNLKQEPQADKDERVDFEEQRDEQDRDHHDETRQRKQPHIASENAGNCAGGAQCGYDRSRVEHDMRSRSREATREIECQIAEMTQTILNRRTEQPQRPRVQDEIEPSAVQKHHGEEGHEIHCGQIALPGCKGFRIARGNQRKLT
jgi:hypothetical protein